MNQQEFHRLANARTGSLGGGKGRHQKKKDRQERQYLPATAQDKLWGKKKGHDINAWKRLL